MKIPMVIATPDGPSASGSGPGLLADLLTKFEETLSSLGVPARDYLGDGVGRSLVIEQLATVGLETNAELEAWFGWHNGRAGGPDESGLGYRVLPGFSQLSLEDAVSRYRSLTVDFVVPDGVDPVYSTNGVGRGWLVLTVDPYGFAMNCEGGPEVPPLVRKPEEEYFDEYFEGRLQVVSLCTLVTWWLEALQSGATTWNSSTQSWSDLDVSLVSAIRRDSSFY